MVTAPILLVDCARPDPVVGLLLSGDLHLQSVPRHPDDERGLCLFTTLERLLQTNQLTWAALAAVAIGIGPGPMNGTRVGLSLATGLCKTLKLGVIAVPAWYAYANINLKTPQRLTLALGRSGFASADITVSTSGWRCENCVLSVSGIVSSGPSAAAYRQALLDNQPQPLASIRPIYLRQPDVEPQFDLFGRPLASGV